MVRRFLFSLLQTSKFARELGGLGEETPEGLAALLKLFAKLMASGVKDPIDDEVLKVMNHLLFAYVGTYKQSGLECL